MASPAFNVGNVRPIKWISKQTYTWCFDKTYLDGEKVALCSPCFEVKTNNQITEWQIVIKFDKSVSTDLKDFISIFISNRNNFSVEAQIHFCFLNSRNEHVGSRNMGLHTYKPRDRYGYPSYALHSSITDEKTDIIINGQLQLKCDIRIRDSDKIVDHEHTDKSILSADFEKLLGKEEFGDVTLKIKDGKSFKLHKSILVARSPVFEAMFRSGMMESHQNEVDIPDFSYEVMDQLFRYIYTGRISVKNFLAEDLLKAADKYNIKSLMVLCEKSLCDQMTSSNVIKYLELADMHNALLLKEEAIEYISLHVDEIVDMPGLETLISSHPALIFKIFGAIKSQCYRKTDAEEKHEISDEDDED